MLRLEPQTPSAYVAVRQRVAAPVVRQLAAWGIGPWGHPAPPVTIAGLVAHAARTPGKGRSRKTDRAALRRTVAGERRGRSNAMPSRMPLHPASVLERGHSLAFSRLISPELCLIAPPSCPRGRREGRVLTSHPRSAAQNAENRTAAYRWCRSLGLPCAMVGRLMPCSPGSRVPSGLPRPRRIHRRPRRLTQMPPPQELDRSNDGQDHTVLPYARPAISPQFFQPCRRSRKPTDETKPSSAVRPRDAQGSRRAIRPAPSYSRPTLPRPPQARARERDDHTIAPQG